MLLLTSVRVPLQLIRFISATCKDSYTVVSVTALSVRGTYLYLGERSNQLVRREQQKLLDGKEERVG